jgi:HAD superfamily hydrolase (TIGR01549 family)
MLLITWPAVGIVLVYTLSTMTTPFLPTDLRAVIFDLDGTLLDSFAGHLAAYKVTFNHFGLPASLDDLLRVYSPNWLQVYRAMGLPEQHWQEADAIWLAEAARHTPELFPGTVELLEALRPCFALGLVTSGSSERVRRDLERTGLDRRFQVIITGGDVCQPKPDPEGLLSALRLLGITPDQAVFVGDAAADAHMAQAAGVSFIGMLTQFSGDLPPGEYPRMHSLLELIQLFTP